ncbi:MAG: phosphoribosylformylglycinamidine synthase subunit PurL [Schleiferiaceae bacterium]|jgi:phosphoribosylformylglycinamidine synthase|nr:phosphoribosylformylglycinamidine synthase subunit PurL [Schleiferiaceae bacterium]MDP4627711.1 phosphoribosylformylglycinamidine synthase subunit PurL [Schleiferiaceae bacterium]MDP4728006.1 phosphoribosylformylglycinamidine synthase subunit PurL [Schleiferiaceae bacterium]MDP4749924.1 phosphoribosylformylglycinamidine synthase subunit PurL [Schleiferiaceae bacterium]MDP4860137.1 phosphoribosylformylglycinamidine synthase subunit PurL [Schleiferiaceae bacterium]
MLDSFAPTTVENAIELGLLPEEYAKICEVLGRTPNFTELSVYSVMWSEHCSYKNSIVWLKTLPKEGPHLLAKAGEENAGLVDIGDGWACAFKIESHNHPSAVEPYQGAATGVGGINRDIFTMGARPIAQLNSLRFGRIEDERTQWLLKGVVKGIGNYGNSFGIPTVGGEVYFDDCYLQNPLVNAFSAGIVKVGEQLSAKAQGVGNPVYIVGSSTGRDGIHGAAFASKDLTEDSANDIPSVQVGDPFQEKLLLEATLELSQTGAVAGMQDMGAAGITCSTSEMSAGGGVGMDIHLDRVPTRQDGMTPWEILLSESQERMLVVVKKGRETEVEAIFAKWDIHCAEIGVVTEGPAVRYFWHGDLVGDLPAESLVLGGGAPVYYREFREPAYYKAYQEFDIQNVAVPQNLHAVSQQIIALPNIASKRWVYEQYDSMVGTVNMSTNSPSDAAIVKVKGTDRALAMTVDCNSRYVHADPEVGTMIAVAENARNIVCSGGVPSAITNCLNFGNPYNPEVYWQFVGAIKGMSRACEQFKTPVTGGNVSFYNQTVMGNKAEPVFPTPTIAMIGLVEDKSHVMTLNFKEKGDLIYQLGTSREDISSSQYLVYHHGITESPAPFFSLEEEYALQEQVKMLIRQGVLQSAHDVSEGGLFVALMESSMAGNLGFDVTTDSEIRTDAFLFGESQSRVVVTVAPDQEEAFIDLMMLNGVEFDLLGHVTKGSIRIDDEEWGQVAEYKDRYDNALHRALGAA